MNKCDYCGKDLNRHIFCSNSHRVLFNRNKGKPKIIKEVKDIPKEFSKPKSNLIRPFKSKTKFNFGKASKVEPSVVPVKIKGYCKHGYMIGLCKYGCKK